MNFADSEMPNTSEFPGIGFWNRFQESHQLMQWTNANLKPEGKDKYSPYSQKPWMWPICYKVRLLMFKITYFNFFIKNDSVKYCIVLLLYNIKMWLLYISD